MSTIPSWIWNNTTQVAFGENSVKEHLKNYLQPKWRVMCLFGGSSIEKNGSKKDVQDVLDELQCEVKWEGGIPANPEYQRLCEILKVAREFKPNFLIAIGGGSIIDGTKFVHAALGIPEDVEPWNVITDSSLHPKDVCGYGVVLTLPASGSEWNNGFVISRHATQEKKSGHFTYPTISIIDPRYTMTLPVRQLRNGIFDSMCHCIDLCLTEKYVPMMNNIMFSIMREIYDISLDLLKPNSSLELHGRLCQAATFCLNSIPVLGLELDVGIHNIGHALTAEYGIDHASTLSMVAPYFLEMFAIQRKATYARAAERIFDICEGTDEEKALAFAHRITQWINDIGQLTKVSQWPGAVIKDGDVDKVTKMVMAGRTTFGYHGSIKEENVRAILEKVIV